jgi:LmbE family N-acetylglucosaminyl deacetylase
MVNGVLAVVSHPDDESFGCGGTLAKHARAGINTNVVCLTCNPETRKTEFDAATTVLDVEATILMEKNIRIDPETIRKVADLIDDIRPSIVITHLPFDYHREHKTCYSIVKEAIEWTAHTTIYENAWQVKRLLLMEVNTLIPNPDLLVDISSSFNVKMSAVDKYVSQLAKFPWDYYQRVNTKKSELRGAQCNVDYAEAFIEETLSNNGPFYTNKYTNLLV